MNLTELYLIAMVTIFAVPYAVWRLLRIDYYAPLVVVQIVGGVLLGPGCSGPRTRTSTTRSSPRT